MGTVFEVKKEIPGKMLSRFAIAIVLTAISLSPVTAQVRGSASGPMGIIVTPGTMGTGTAATGASGFGIAATAGFQGRGVVGSSARFHQGHAVARRAILLPYPYLYSDYGSGSEEAAQPRVVVVSASAPSPPSSPPAPLESLLIEWQGDHFVRTTMSQKALAGGQIAPDYSEKSTIRSPLRGRSVPGAKHVVQPPRELPPAVLVFRDGRKEEVNHYTIMSGTIYSKAEYWSSGSWTRKIQIADLDVPATLKFNQERGLKFVLPAGPNEVVMRP